MRVAAHGLFGVVLAAVLMRSMDQPWLAQQLGDAWVVDALRASITFAAVAGSALSIVAGQISGESARAFRYDAFSAAALFFAIFVLALGGMSRDTAGLVLVAIVAVRLAAAAWWTVRFGAPPAFVFALCIAFYAPLAGWRVAASLPLGDQVFYLLSAEKLVHGSIDATIDSRRFYELLGIEPQPVDSATHVADSPAGPRLVQGYALAAVLAPGWLIGGEVGATLVISLFAAWAAMQTWLLLGETVGDRPASRVAWALAAFCAPLALAAVHVYPNAVGASVIATGYRLAFTSRDFRPAAAGALLGVTALLNPRDGIVLIALLPFIRAWPRRNLVRFLTGVAGLAIVAELVSLVTFGIPLPYVGYLFGTAAAQTIDPEPTWTFRVWVGLPAILFDRVFGIAGTAPWLFISALGAATALRADRLRLAPAAFATVTSLVVLSLFRLWEGGYAPPNRYIVDILPLATPFVAHGLAVATAALARVLVAAAIGVSALMTAVLLAVPSAELNTAFEDKPRELLAAALGLDPLGWLPSFQPTTPDWWIAAYLRLVPALLLVALLAVLGWRRERA